MAMVYGEDGEGRGDEFAYSSLFLNSDQTVLLLVASWCESRPLEVCFYHATIHSHFFDSNDDLVISSANRNVRSHNTPLKLNWSCLNRGSVDFTRVHRIPANRCLARSPLYVVRTVFRVQIPRQNVATMMPLTPD